MFQRILATAGLFAATGCASWSYERPIYARLCQEADWEQLYYDAGIKVGPESRGAKARLEVLEEACPYNKIKPPPEAKAAAEVRITKEFCPPDKAYDWGRAGHVNPKICAGGFDVSWNRGYRDFLILQLEYLNRDGTYLATYNKYLNGMNVSKKQILQYNMAMAEAEQLTINELKIKALAPRDEGERRKLINDYTRALSKARELK